MRRLSKEQIVMLHDSLIEQTGGEYGLHEDSLLESAINAPFQTFDGLYVYPSLEMKAARLAFSLIKNHPFVDGNKRIGMLVMMTFLEMNGVFLDFTDDEMIEVGLRVADGSMSDRDLFQWILEVSI